MTKKNIAAKSGGGINQENSLLGNNSSFGGEGASPVAMPANGADAALYATILADAPAAPMPMDPDTVENISRLAAHCKLWCGYQLMPPDESGRIAKKPLSADGKRHIGVNNPGAWYKLEAAMELVETGHASGVGTLMSAANGLVVVDMDRCVDSAGNLLDWAAEAVKRLNSYTEWSPSGTGVHIVLFGNKPDGQGQDIRNGRGLTRPNGDSETKLGEIFAAGGKGFVTVTGKLYDTRLCNIEDRQSELEGWLNYVQGSANTGGGGSVGAGSAGQVGRAGADAANDAGSGAEGLGSGGAAPAPAAANVGAVAEGRKLGTCVVREVDEIAALLKVHNKRGRLQRLAENRLNEPELREFPAGSESEIDAAIMAEVVRFTDDPEQAVWVFGEIAPQRVATFEARKKHAGYLMLTAKSCLKSRFRTFDDEQAEKQREKAQRTELVEQRQMSFAALLAGGVGNITTNRRGGAYASMANLQEIIGRAHALVGVFVHDEFDDKVKKLGQLPREIMPPVRLKGSLKHGTFLPLEDADVNGIAIWVSSQFGAEFRAPQVNAAVQHAARHHQLNSVADPLSRLVWDGRDRIDTWLVDYCNADVSEDDTGYVEAVGAMFLIQAVARAFEPGEKADCVLILEGEQGSNKSTAIRILGEAIAPHTFREHLPDLRGSDAKELQQVLSGAWICEFQEMKNLRGSASVEHTKAILTTREDCYRTPYGMHPKLYPRTAVFIGSVNPDGAGYLADPTGGRRYWPIKVGIIDLEALRADAGQLFAEAVYRFKRGDKYWIDAGTELHSLAGEAVARRMPYDAWYDILLDKLPDVAGQLIKMRYIWEGLQKMGSFTECRGTKMTELSRTLRTLNCVPKKQADGNYWLIPRKLL